MSRKPPKLVAMGGKPPSSAAEKKGSSSDTMPPLKQVTSGVKSSSADPPNNSLSSGPSLRRSSGLTRHFLGFNGSTATANKRRFLSKVVKPAAGAVTLQLKNSASSKSTPDDEEGVSSSPSNGCGGSGASPLPVTAPKKVNGTISNGINSKPSEPTKQFPKKVNSSGGDTGDGEESSSSDSHQNSGITFTNGRKVESSNSRNSASTNNSQNVRIGNATKRTSRFSQNSNLVSSKVSTPSTSRASSPPPDDEMPALIPYSTAYPSPVINETLPPDNTEPPSDNNALLEEPKIIRKGDTVIKSYVDEKTGRIAVFEKEMKLEVCDFGSGRWYPAKVKNINWAGQMVLVHYSNWSSRYDEWIQMQSKRLRPSDDTNVISLQFVVGERVEALWSLDSKKYPGTIIQALPQDMYEVKFDDGIKMKRSANQLFKASHSEPPSLPPSAITEPPPEPEPAPIPAPQVSETPVMEPPNKFGTRRRRPVVAAVVPNREPIRRKSMIRKAPENTPPPATATTASAVPDPSEVLLPDGSRPAHFSVFDPPPSDLGKRRRTVHDYSILVRGRTPQVRRPRSEGVSSTATEETDLTEEDSSIIAEDVPPPRAKSPPKHVVSKETTEVPTESAPTRRRKSGTATQVPTTVKPSLDSPKELPVIEEPVTEETIPPPVDRVETTSKKRKCPALIPATPPIPSTVDSSTPSKPETTAQASSSSVEVAAAATVSTVSTTASATTSSTSSRRTKSLGVIPLSSVPSQVQTDVPKENDTKVDSGFADGSGNPIIIEQNSEDGFWKCPLNKCGKNFRKDSLLKMHLKHYHPELKVTRGIANVVQMAQARTAFENEHPSDHHGWQKLPSTDLSPAIDGSSAETSKDSSTTHASDATPSHKRIPKSAAHSKENSPEKVSPALSHKSESGPSIATPASGDMDASEDPSQALSQSPSKLRLSRRRNFVVNKLGRIRANNKLLANTVTPHRKRRDPNGEGSARTVIATDNSKKSKILSSADASITTRDVLVGEQNAARLVQGSIRLPSPSKLEKRSDQFSYENSGSPGSEPYLVPPSCESDILSSEASRLPRGRWNKPHIRRSLMSSNRRRVGSSILPTSTSLSLKKRMQMRKFIGKRRQKRTSILSRISSGRMRVILEALNQRSLKRRRFRADRRYRDVKVDVINCVCNNKTEFGLMIQCELCLCWQHGSCFNVQSNSQLPEYYACQSCSEPDRARLSRKYEWAESEFYKLGKLPSFPFAPSFPKEDSRTMKTCTNLTSSLVETFSMIKGLKLKERVCFGHPEHPQLYQWNTERIPPDEELQRDRFNKYFQPVLRRLMIENKSDGTYSLKLKKLAEVRMRLKKYSDAVESARLTMKKKLGCRAAAYVHYICDILLDDMIKIRRRSALEDSVSGLQKETMEGRRRTSAEQAYHRLAKLKEEVRKIQCKDRLHQGLAEQRLENGLGPSVSSASYVSTTSPLKSGGVPSTSSNGLKKDAAANVRDFCVLRRYLKERRTINTNICTMLVRMSKQFPDEWKNLMKSTKEFVPGSRKQSIIEEDKFKWVSNVILTYNTLRILLRNIYSESNVQKQRSFCSEFEKLTMKLFDLFGIGLIEERQDGRKDNPSKHHQVKRTKGLESLETMGEVTSAASILLKTRVSSSEHEETDEAMKDLLKRLGTSTKPLSSQDIEDVLATAAESKCEDEVKAPSSSAPSSARPSDADTKSSTAAEDIKLSLADRNSSCMSLYFGCRRFDGHLVSDVSDKVQLIDAVRNAAGIPAEECTEENVTLSFPDKNAGLAELPSHSGIIPVPASSRITSEVCKKNLVRDIVLQQHQIDLYLDKIEAQIIKLSSQSRQSTTVNAMKPSEMSERRDKMLHSMELVSRLSKTLIGENDAVEPEDMDVSEATLSDSSDLGSSSESDDGDNTSNYSGTDTETADEGDNSDHELLLDI